MPSPYEREVLPLERILDEQMPALRDYIRKRSGQLVASRESASDLAQSVCREVIEPSARSSTATATTRRTSATWAGSRVRVPST